MTKYPGPEQLSGPKVMAKLDTGADPLDVLIEIYERTAQCILAGRPIKLCRLQPVQTRLDRADPVCALYDGCHECPMQGELCDMIDSFVQNPNRTVDQAIEIVKKMKGLRDE